ncbi:MAG: RNA-binding domain-containing protein [Candidatus Altiarchaeota archaeon]
MKVHNIRVRAFFRDENLDEGRMLFKRLLPEETTVCEEKLEPETEGEVFTTPLTALNAVISTQSLINEFIKKILSSLSDSDKEELKNTLQSRMDDDCSLYIRLGKKELQEGKFVLHTRDSVHVRIKLACFPKKKENALKIASELLE